MTILERFYPLICFIVGYAFAGWVFYVEGYAPPAEPVITDRLILEADAATCTPVEIQDKVTGEWGPEFTYFPSIDRVHVVFNCEGRMMDYWRPAE